jgi:lipoyl(octanoyl) transferase
VRTVGCWLDLGRQEYLSCCRFQEQLVAMRREGTIPDTIVAVEHAPCITVGRAGGEENVLADGAELARLGVEGPFSSTRGGDVTYHGPGQVVIYPVIDLGGHGRDVHAYARGLEEIMMRAAATFGVDAWRVPGYPGVWTSAGKVGALGVAVRGWVTMHGAALNVAPNMSHFAVIVPCGLEGRPVTSLSDILGRPLDAHQVRQVMREACEDVFGLSLEDASREELFGNVAGGSRCQTPIPAG